MNSYVIYLLVFLITIILGNVIIPVFSKNNTRQSTSTYLERHANKNGTPTMGGIIFLIPFFIISIILLIKNFSFQVLLLLICTFGYFVLGFIDDYIKVKQKNNAGLSINVKFFLELLIAITFYFLYSIWGNDNNLCIFNKCYDVNFFYGILMFLMLVGTTNAVNITDGLDGLCAGIMIMCLSTYSLFINNANLDFIIACLISSLFGFLYFNYYPAKIFMGDLGSLSLGAILACISILTHNELILLIVGLTFILEILSSFFQVIFIKYFHRKLFLKAPLHHHFEELGFSETSIVTLFYIITFIVNIIAIFIKLI